MEWYLCQVLSLLIALQRFHYALAFILGLGDTAQICKSLTRAFQIDRVFYYFNLFFHRGVRVSYRSYNCVYEL